VHRYVPGFFCWIQHERLGGQTGATPDGRHAGWPLADGAGAAQGRERSGPTAAVLSTTKWSHRKALGGLVHNIKFSDSVAGTAGGRKAIRHAVETFLLRGGFEIQVNVVGKETLLKAREQPELSRLHEAIVSHQTTTVIIRNYRKNGTMFWNELSISPLHDDQDRLTHFIGVQTDITKRKLAEDTIQRAREMEVSIAAHIQQTLLIADVPAVCTISMYMPALLRPRVLTVIFTTSIPMAIRF